MYNLHMLLGKWTSLRCSVRLMVLGALLGLAVALAPSRFALADLRPLVRVMLENLSDVNQIGLGIAVEDHALVEQAARRLGRRAKRVKKIPIPAFGFDRARNDEFDAYLTAQTQVSTAIANAAKQQDVRAALHGMQQLTAICMACHQTFREPARLLRPPVIFMTTLLKAWREITRGLAINNFSLIEQQAREIETIERALNKGSVIDETFGPHDPEDREVFQSYLRLLGLQANKIEQAAAEKDGAMVALAVQEMWEGGCIPCHERFR